MKKIVISFTLFTLLFTCLLFAQEFTASGIKYRITSSTTVEVSGYNTEASKIVIPSTVTHYNSTYTVTTVGVKAFHPNSLTSFTIPSITAIGVNPFYPNSLTSVIIPNSVIIIGEYAFYDNDLTTITIPESVTTIGDAAFYANDLTSITIPKSIKTIGDSTFGYNELTSVISESLHPATLNDGVFDNRSVINLSIPTGTTQAYVTAGWTGFKSVTEATIFSVNYCTLLH
ncbi:hypothetical protein GCM10022393_00460 [Aquimarina addita]|uniref:Leucine rich repeat (LRR) protein n=1 Tax=Aquimarina addita TaxID=870485 RepID=A0ABP7X711_9FLAO